MNDCIKYENLEISEKFLGIQDLSFLKLYEMYLCYF